MRYQDFKKTFERHYKWHKEKVENRKVRRLTSSRCVSSSYEGQECQEKQKQEAGATLERLLYQKKKNP